MHFEKDGCIRLNGVKSHDDAGSDLVFKFLGKYVKKDNFTINSPHGDYTLYLRNGDGTRKYVKNGTIFYVRLNGRDVFTPLDYTFTSQVLKKNVTVLQNNTLGEIQSANPNVVKCLVWVSILTLICSRQMLRFMRSLDKKNAHLYTHLQWAKAFTEGSHRIMEEVLKSMNIELDMITYLQIVMGQGKTPNINRERMMDK